MTTERITTINPKGLYDPTIHAYAHVTVVPAWHKQVYISGQGGQDLNGDLAADFRSQLKQAFQNIATALASVGLTFKDVVKQTTLVVSHDAEKVRILVEESLLIWPDQRFPANTLIPVPCLALEKMLIEIEVIA